MSRLFLLIFAPPQKVSSGEAIAWFRVKPGPLSDSEAETEGLAGVEGYVITDTVTENEQVCGVLRRFEKCSAGLFVRFRICL